MKKVLFLVLIVLLANISLASVYNIEMYQYGERLLEKHEIILDNAEPLILNLPEEITSLDIENSYNESDGKIVVNDKIIRFSFVNTEAIEKGGKYYLTRKIIPGLYMDELNIRLVLDEGFVLNEVFPSEDHKESDGRKIIIEWYFEDVPGEESTPVFVVFESVKSSNYLLGVLVIILIGIIGLILWKKREKIVIKKEKKPKKKRKIEEFLLDDEKKVVDELIKENGLWQKQIQLRTGFNKVKLSRVLKNLEKRRLIRKVNFGKTNKIYLKSRKI